MTHLLTLFRDKGFCAIVPSRIELYSYLTDTNCTSTLVTGRFSYASKMVAEQYLLKQTPLVWGYQVVHMHISSPLRFCHS